MDNLYELHITLHAMYVRHGAMCKAETPIYIIIKDAVHIPSINPADPKSKLMITVRVSSVVSLFTLPNTTLVSPLSSSRVKTCIRNPNIMAGGKPDNHILYRCDNNRYLLSLTIIIGNADESKSV